MLNIYEAMIGVFARHLESSRKFGYLPVVGQTSKKPARNRCLESAN